MLARKMALAAAMAAVVSTQAVETEVSFLTPTIVRISRVPDTANPCEDTGVCLLGLPSLDVGRQKTCDGWSYASDSLIVNVSSNGAVAFLDARTGGVLLAEDAAVPVIITPVVRENVIYDDATARVEDTANGQVTVKDVLRRDTIGVDYAYTLNLDFGNPGALYGLGSHIEGHMNLLGKTLHLVQHNLKATIPVLVSPAGYGLLVDAGCAIKFSSDSVPGGYTGTMELDAADRLDYYFIKGAALDDVVAGYRTLTGAASMMPRHLFGYTQSKERYTSQQELIDVAAEYRRRGLPLDMIVQDWNYWPEGWGYMKMDERYYPDPAALADSLHAMDVKLMVSIWPNPQGCPQEREFRERGFMLPNSVYDAFNPDARRLYWEYADREFFSRGFDAWWCDSSEPVDGDWNQLPAPVDGRPYSRDDHERRWQLNKDALSATLGAKRANLYSLYHSRGIYESQRGASDAKRVVNLTRSTYAGQQRYGTIVWNGDTYASWESFRRQIPSGLNYMATGNPYWTVDVGGFFTRSSDRWFWTGEFPGGADDEGYREYYTRMFQWGTFLPVLRSHGTDTPREVWRFGEPGTPYYDAIAAMLELRYSLVPYLYSLAAATHVDDYTMARLLAFDFPTDANVLDIADQYMLGDILVCPVTEPGATSRRVYLPADGGALWTDFWTGDRIEGGRWIEAEAPIDRLPLYVRAGAIIPMTEPGESTVAQASNPVTLHVYPGRDGRFTLYHDAGDGYDFERGDFSRLHFSWDDRAGHLDVVSEGSYRAPVYSVEIH